MFAIHDIMTRHHTQTHTHTLTKCLLQEKESSQTYIPQSHKEYATLKCTHKKNTNLQHPCGVSKPTMWNSSRLCASHSPLCLRVCDVSDASWFSVLLWLLAFSKQQWHCVPSGALNTSFDCLTWSVWGQCWWPDRLCSKMSKVAKVLNS